MEVDKEQDSEERMDIDPSITQDNQNKGNQGDEDDGDKAVSGSVISSCNTDCAQFSKVSSSLMN